MTDATMRAYRLLDWEQPGFADIPMPAPGPGQVRVRIGGVGLCHSDVLFLTAPAGILPYQVPFTLGHEIAGWVDEVGPGVDDLPADTAVAVACMSTCGRCRWCRRGADNYCVDSWHGRGFGLDGGLASHIVVARRDIVAIGALDPRDAAPLTDAGATSYHAVRRVLPKLRPGSTAVVIGVGGLGGYAVQWLRMLSPARIIAVESREERLAVARTFGAHDVLPAGDGLSKRLREALGSDGADAVLDFVGNDQTMNAALRNAAPMGSVAIVGQGFGAAELRFGRLAHDCDVFIPQGAPIAELAEVIALAQTGDVIIETETFSFDETAAAYDRLTAGTLNGRAVVIPTG
ncbi:MAG TPA: alcohol dehydrogenase catalytic domain-containing protein [Mycobacteriales bacterium]|nr:alcohol dehydrogenase catalytic domain-containing protein [Mycobacteriales bacterium]